MTVYLDVCCLNRPFDDQSQNRVRLEAEAVMSILEMAAGGKLKLVSSDIIEDELSQMPDDERREKVELLLDASSKYVSLTRTLSVAPRRFINGTSHRWTLCIWRQRKRRTRNIF